MDKSRVCINRTINLAKQKSPKKTNLLVYGKTSGPQRVKPSYIPLTISAAPAKKIRVCTGAELKKMCPAPPCVCPPKKRGAASIADILMFGLKGALAGSIVYWTWEAGLWGDSEETEKFYTNICHLLTEGHTKDESLSDVCELELDFRKQVPDAEDLCSRPPFSNEKALYRAKEFWNHLVTFLFEGAVGFPFNVIDWARKPSSEDTCTPVSHK